MISPNKFIIIKFIILELDETQQYHDNWKIPEYPKYSENPPEQRSHRRNRKSTASCGRTQGPIGPGHSSNDVTKSWKI